MTNLIHNHNNSVSNTNDVIDHSATTTTTTTATATATTNTTSTAANDHTTFFHSYACITCLEPSHVLYKQYSNAHNIKLQTCPKCHNFVDPYIERELILVIMDMILLRRCAYRHLFFHRHHWWGGCGGGGGGEENIFAWLSFWECVVGGGHDKQHVIQYDKNKNHYKMEGRKRLVMVLFIALMGIMFKIGLKLYASTGFGDILGEEEYFNTAVCMESEKYSVPTTNSAYSSITDWNGNVKRWYRWYPLVLASLGEMMALWFGTMVGTVGYIMFVKKMGCRHSVVANHGRDNSQDSGHDSESGSDMDEYGILYESRLHGAIFLPQLFHGMTLFVCIYENSYMVRILGEVFVSCFGYMAVGTILEKWYPPTPPLNSVAQPSSNPRHSTSFLCKGLPYLVGCCFEMGVGFFLSQGDGMERVCRSLE